MTIELFARRFGASLMYSGVGLFVAAVVCWASVGDGGTVVHSIHTVAGSVLAVLGLVAISTGFAISAAVPSQAGQISRALSSESPGNVNDPD